MPRPGDERQLKRLAARIISQHLDHTKPLWEIWIVEGLEGDRSPHQKAHHCMVDGIAGADLLTVLLQIGPDDEISRRSPGSPAPPERVGSRRRGGARINGRVQLSRSADRPPPRRSRTDPRPGARGASRRSARTRPASQTPLNPPGRPAPALRLAAHDRSEVKAVRAALGGTVNDVMLATVIGAMRRFLERRWVPLSGLDFRVLIPVSVRAPVEHAALGNKVAQMFARLPIDEVEPGRRLARVIETPLSLKQSHQVHTTELMEHLSDWTATTLLAEIMRLAARQRTYNLVRHRRAGTAGPALHARSAAL